MKSKDLLGKPLRLEHWEAATYFIPERIDPEFWIGEPVYIGTCYRGLKITTDDWFPVRLQSKRRWLVAYNILASLEIEEWLND